MASQKGGTGKTTLSGHLAVEAQNAGVGQVALIDTDPQGSLSHWWNARAAAEPLFVKVGPFELGEAIEHLTASGVKLAVIGWHTGVLGKLVFFIGLAVLLLVILREAGIELPPSVPESLLVLGLGALAAIFVLIRLISIPDSMLPANGRGIGIWISLLASLGVIVAGLLRASEEL